MSRRSRALALTIRPVRDLVVVLEGPAPASVEVRGAGFGVSEPIHSDLTFKMGGSPDQGIAVGAMVGCDLRSRIPLRARPGETPILRLRQEAQIFPSYREIPEI